MKRSASRGNNMKIHTESEKTHIFNLVKKIGPIDVIYDCGSRDALDGLELAIETGAKELHVFECNPPSVEVCRSNIKKHKPDGLIVYLNDCAISDKLGTISFFPIDVQKTVTTHADGNPGASSLFQANPEYPNEKYIQNEITVKTITLDEYCLTHRPPDLL